MTSHRGPIRMQHDFSGLMVQVLQLYLTHSDFFSSYNTRCNQK